MGRESNARAQRALEDFRQYKSAPEQVLTQEDEVGTWKAMSTSLNLLVKSPYL